MTRKCADEASIAALREALIDVLFALAVLKDGAVPPDGKTVTRALEKGYRTLGGQP